MTRWVVYAHGEIDYDNHVELCLPKNTRLLVWGLEGLPIRDKAAELISSSSMASKINENLFDQLIIAAINKTKVLSELLSVATNFDSKHDVLESADEINELIDLLGESNAELPIANFNADMIRTYPAIVDLLDDVERQIIDTYTKKSLVELIVSCLIKDVRLRFELEYYEVIKDIRDINDIRKTYLHEDNVCLQLDFTSGYNERYSNIKNGLYKSDDNENWTLVLLDKKDDSYTLNQITKYISQNGGGDIEVIACQMESDYELSTELTYKYEDTTENLIRKNLALINLDQEERTKIKTNKFFKETQHETIQKKKRPGCEHNNINVVNKRRKTSSHSK